MTGEYVSVNGLSTYYEVHGEGEPLLLMHGGFCTVEVLAALRAELSQHYRVYAPERRGHGRTADFEGPYNYERMAEDTIGYMEVLGLQSAHLVGFSDGANTALVVAIQRPDLVRTIVSMGGNFHCDGIASQFHGFMDSATPENFMPDLVAAYKQHGPDGPEHFPIVFEKIMTMWRTEPGADRCRPRVHLRALAHRLRRPRPHHAGTHDRDVPRHTQSAALRRTQRDTHVARCPGRPDRERGDTPLPGGVVPIASRDTTPACAPISNTSAGNWARRPEAPTCAPAVPASGGTS